MYIENRRLSAFLNALSIIVLCGMLAYTLVTGSR